MALKGHKIIATVDAGHLSYSALAGEIGLKRRGCGLLREATSDPAPAPGAPIEIVPEPLHPRLSSPHQHRVNEYFRL